MLYDIARFIIVVTRNRCCKERVSENREVSRFRRVVAETKNFRVPDWDFGTKKSSLLWLFIVFIIFNETYMEKNCK